MRFEIVMRGNVKNIMMMDAADSSLTSVHVYPNTQRSIPEDRDEGIL
jgi:hypothetical protein